MKFTGFSPLVFAGISVNNSLAIEKSIPFLSQMPGLKTPIQEIYPAVFNNEIYVAGGFIPSTTPAFFGLSPSEENYIFSPKLQKWRTGPSLPAPRHHLGMASNSKYLYAIGGFTGKKGNAWQPQKTVWRLSEAKEQWSSAPSLPVPIAESVHVSLLEKIHVIGGKSPNSESKNRDSKKHYLLVDNKHWETAAPPSINRNSAAGAGLNNRIYVVGGRQVGDSTKKAKNLSYFEVYDSNLDKWEKIRPLPQALAGLTATPLNGKIVVTGGEAFGPNGNWKTGTVSSAIWIYDPLSDQWGKEAKLNETRHGHGAATIGNNLYIIGGAAKVGPQDTLGSMVKLSWRE
ncbi:Kelch repeat-containing protein [Microbulbifer sp. VTAC004]|uniref:Kelch repeat-containing protein n=1 Tax=unclassified Microbulbifer TaxID=2619833 RepID=UPI004039DE15